MTQSTSQMVQSYTRVRLALGVLGLLMPCVLLLGGLTSGARIEPTISDFFHTIYRDIYVGTLFAIGVFLFSYRGYTRDPGERFSDDWLTTAAGLAAIGMALFPTPSPTGEVETVSQLYLGLGATPVGHYLSAWIFFSCLSVMCFSQFTRGASPRRRKIYRACGWVMLAALFLTLVSAIIKNFTSGALHDLVLNLNLIFWFEAIGVWAFGVSWIVKSKANLIGHSAAT